MKDCRDLLDALKAVAEGGFLNDCNPQYPYADLDEDSHRERFGPDGRCPRRSAYICGACVVYHQVNEAIAKAGEVA